MKSRDGDRRWEEFGMGWRKQSPGLLGRVPGMVQEADRLLGLDSLLI